MTDKEQVHGDEHGFLENRRCYLSGAIEDDETDGRPWREKFSDDLSVMFGVVPLNPLRKNEYFNSLDYVPEDDPDLLYAKQDGRYDEYRQKVKTIRHMDLRMVDHSDFLIVHIDPDIQSCGTWEELFIANRQQKPIIVYIKGYKSDIPGWLYGTLPHETFFCTYDDVINYLSRIDMGDIDDANKDRWLL